jgi:NAD(P)-dependent dehydrogenase (short-subunit alcohol dehydrogenase family)
VNRQKGRLNEPPFFVSTLAHYRSRESGGRLSWHVAMVAGARGNRCVAYRTHNHAAGGRAVALPGDVQNESYANQLVGLATRQFGGLDIAFNNAATMGELGSIVDMSRENWTRTLETNLTSAFLGAKISDSGDARSRWRLVDLHVDLCGPYLAKPEEIARSALYLASDASSFTTGIALLSDGGVSITRT